MPLRGVLLVVMEFRLSSKFCNGMGVIPREFEPHTPQLLLPIFYHFSSDQASLILFSCFGEVSTHQAVRQP